MRKRSSYRPRAVVTNNLAYILIGNMPVTVADSVVTRVRIANHGALDTLVKGQGSLTDVSVLGHMITTATALAQHGKGRDWLPELAQARAALGAIAARGGSRCVLRAGEITALNLAIEVHDEQLNNCTIKELEEAIRISKGKPK